MCMVCITEFMHSVTPQEEQTGADDGETFVKISLYFRQDLGISESASPSRFAMKVLKVCRV